MLLMTTRDNNVITALEVTVDRHVACKIPASIILNGSLLTDPAQPAVSVRKNDT